MHGRKVALAVLTAAMLGIGLWRWRTYATAVWNHAPDQVLFQYDMILGGPVTESECGMHVPYVTVFGDGRVVFTKQTQGNDMHLYEARIAEKQLQALVMQAKPALLTLRRQSGPSTMPDERPQVFVLVTPDGTQDVEVYGSGLRRWWEHRALQRLVDRVAGLLPPDATPYVPETLDLAVRREDFALSPDLPPWPAGLPRPPADQPDEWARIAVSAAAVQEAARMPVWPRQRFRDGEKGYAVRVLPGIPVLHHWCQ